MSQSQESDRLLWSGKQPRAFSSVLVVTGFTLLGQVIGFATQLVTASLFGAGAGMDAFFAGTAMPQYLIAVLTGALGMVFVPVFMEYSTSGRGRDAWQVASSLMNICLLGLGGVALLGALFSGFFLTVSAPGLSAPVRLQAAQIAAITWPAVVASGLIVLLTGIYQSQSRFAWPAAVSAIGALLGLGLLVLLRSRLGTFGLALAATVGILLQVALLAPMALKHERYRATLHWRHPGVLQVLWLLLPLVLANAVAKATPVIDRFLASGMPPGSISHLGYAFQIFTVLSVLISTGIATVIFPRMALNATSLDFANLRKSTSAALRVMWIAIAPATTIGIVLALPLVVTVFERGQFGPRDAAAVAGLLQVYLLALAPASLGSITGRGFYVVRDTRTFGLLSGMESIAYVVYTAYLARLMGPVGVVVGFVIYFNISFIWTVAILRYRMGRAGGRRVLGSFLRTGLAALLAGAAAWAVTQSTSTAWLQIVLGAVSGLSVYGLALWFLKSPEVQEVWGSLRP